MRTLYNQPFSCADQPFVRLQCLELAPFVRCQNRSFKNPSSKYKHYPATSVFLCPFSRTSAQFALSSPLLAALCLTPPLCHRRSVPLALERHAPAVTLLKELVVAFRVEREQLGGAGAAQVWGQRLVYTVPGRGAGVPRPLLPAGAVHELLL